MYIKEETKQITTSITEDTESILIDQLTSKNPELIQLRITMLFT